LHRQSCRWETASLPVERAKLLHYRKLIWHSPVFDDFPVLQPDEIYHIDFDPPTCRGDTHEFSLVSSGAPHSEPDSVVYFIELLDGQMEVGKTLSQGPDNRTDGVLVGRGARWESLMLHKGRVHDSVNDR